MNFRLNSSELFYVFSIHRLTMVVMDAKKGPLTIACQLLQIHVSIRALNVQVHIFKTEQKTQRMMKNQPRYFLPFLCNSKKRHWTNKSGVLFVCNDLLRRNPLIFLRLRSTSSAFISNISNEFKLHKVHDTEIPQLSKIKYTSFYLFSISTVHGCWEESPPLPVHRFHYFCADELMRRAHRLTMN